MNQQNVFTPGQEAWTIWGEKVKLEKIQSRFDSFTLRFISKTSPAYFLVDDNGCFNGTQILFNHPVQVVPVPEFENGEVIEVSNVPFELAHGFAIETGNFVGKLDGRYYVYFQGANVVGLGWKFARKIKKEEPVETKECGCPRGKACGCNYKPQKIEAPRTYSKTEIELLNRIEALERQNRMFADRLHIPESKL